ncbi:hypothetical protein M407DRAFT_32977 [Tulasnella calospora MUT 4182]|uniref:F-box domain-containing protein n=1 Tax=Tulasnella calospora MUT 4182 TaxID=1051891 RepID=A0A0C3L790_9AGAM|nr:hypothetical protein M407DRAFT_32977 [Tulasnella calospora MUT 4182]
MSKPEACWGRVRTTVHHHPFRPSACFDPDAQRHQRRFKMLPPTGFAGLPSELFSAILDEVDPEDLQSVTLALIKSIPNAPISSHHLFRHTRLTRPNQPWLLYQRLGLNRTQTYRRTDQFADPLWIKSFKWLGWAVDADVLNNLLEFLPTIQDLHINVGTTFAPEHLEDLFRNPRHQLQRLSVRFRPYFRQATYYQFLAGAYFDSFLDALSSWPEIPSLTTILIIQDPLPLFDPAEDAPAHALRPSMSFAQPIVFFSLDPITTLAKSPIALHVKHLRFRVPLRTIWNKICEPNAFPSVEILDLSTSPVHPEQAAIALLNGFPRLRHLIVDGKRVENVGSSYGNGRG